ncbi:ABC transporter permease subunit [Desulfosporosinus sp. PR]|uniref:PhnE/PtxC family ABC transporter permease n=1 Tax=Candidatus Desulfosporosinus nitrosoreducens TaxID=3401928 RepID=UPI0027E6F6BC|nr:ABC transporter permease subunit [Desulfosporosinus sp. PR]MDQ7092542.1 ABC transporter permease subunit [Desulfosporosinus sp. PR]
MQLEESMNLWAQLDENLKDNKSSGTNKPWPKELIAMRSILFILAALTVYYLLTMDYQGVNVLKGFADTYSNFKTMFLHPASQRFTWGEAFYNVLITLGLAFLTTLIGGIVALFLGLLAAQNLAPKGVTNLIKGLVAYIRAVPTILWVLIFAVAAGLGSAAAIIGMSFHSISYLTKAYSESFEDLDKSVIEALMASGANWWQIVFQAVIPSSVTYLLSWTFLRFEINFANAVAMGAAAGAGGIGFDLFMAGGFYFDLREVGLITYFILAVAVVLELVSTNMKGMLQKKH